MFQAHNPRPANREPVRRRVSIPAPVGGWNARDSVASMKKEYAFQLDNWFPRSSDIAVRKGSEEHSTGMSGQVESLISYRPVSGAHKLFGIVGGSIFDCTGTGAVGAADVTGLTNSRFQHVNFTTSGGNFLICVNGADDLQLFDGTSWDSIDSGSTPSITGVATSNLIDVNVHQQRVWYIEGSSLSAWYTAAGAFAGALTEFPLGSVFTRGGSLVSMETWTVDAGNGIDDYAAFLTTEGEVAVYQGVDPSSASTWSLVGTFKIGRPLGQNCVTKYGSDILDITVDGVVPLSEALVGGRSNQAIAITDVIRGAVDEAMELYEDNFGWEITHFSGGSMLILNVPVAPDQQEQYVMNTVTGAWCKFTNWPANTFEIHNDELYFGGNGVVYKAWVGTTDDGMAIPSEVVPAFQYFGSGTDLKKFELLRPIFFRVGNPDTIRIGFDVEFDTKDPTSLVSFNTVEEAVWDTAVWDEANWGGGTDAIRRWFSASGLGIAGTPHITATTSNSSLRIAAFDVVFTGGGLI